uniref:Josephin-like protein n=1 Tax=Cannabis sativa TaxID=3483 RepID=A0A803QG18_CANSA
MSRKDRRVNFSPEELNSMPMSDFLKRSVSYRASSSSSPGRSSRRRVSASAGGIWSSFRLQPNKDYNSKQYYSPMSSFLRNLRAKVAKAIRLVSNKRRVEALEDCIEFLNSSASLKRSNSVSSNY